MLIRRCPWRTGKTSAQVFQLRNDVAVGRAVVCGRPVFPDYGTIGVHHEHRGIGVADLTVDLISPGDVALFVVQDGERIALCPGRESLTGEIIYSNG